ncbi:MAG: YraN family protein [Alphaproteobacteria bacterium]
MRHWRRRGGDAEERRAADRRGRTAEALAILMLRVKGYRILARRMRTPAGEIDLIAKRGRVYAFVEVKARPDPQTAGEALGSHQRRRIEQAAAWWIGRHVSDTDYDMRFDLVTLVPGRLPRHLSDAWRPDTG